MDFERLISRRCLPMKPSGIRKIFELASSMTDPIDLSIGQPDFDVPEAIKQAAIDAITSGRNGYTMTVGIPPLRERLRQRLRQEFNWQVGPETGSDVIVTSGTSGGLMLTYLALADAGDEVIVPDPYFLCYPEMAKMVGATAVYCDTYPDFRMTAERVEPLMTQRTRFVVINSPGNPSGVTLSLAEIRDLVDLCTSRGVLLVSDEIYDEFTYPEGRESDGSYASPGSLTQDVLILRGFSKSHGMTGWRIGYAAGPTVILNEMAKLQQYSFVCAPSMVQHAALPALDVDMSAHVQAYARRRDLVYERLAPLTDLVQPTGAFYAFPRIPERLGLTGDQFVRKAIERNVLVIPGSVFSRRDTHFRISYAVSEDRLRQGLDVLADLLAGR